MACSGVQVITDFDSYIAGEAENLTSPVVTRVTMLRNLSRQRCISSSVGASGQ
jgi:hypothetical protein